MSSKIIFSEVTVRQLFYNSPEVVNELERAVEIYLAKPSENYPVYEKIVKVALGKLPEFYYHQKGNTFEVFIKFNPTDSFHLLQTYDLGIGP